jgi:DNA-binding MarR family transcriptional regulator
MNDGCSDLTESQVAVLRALRETGGMEAAALAARLQMKLPELERELVTLRHMERVRGAMRAGKKIVVLWET